MRNYIAEDGKEYEFDRERFRSCFSELHNKENRGKKRKTKEELRREIAEYMPVSEDAVKNWMRKKNGNNPGDLQIVRKLEDFFRAFPLIYVSEGYFLKPVSVKEEDDNMNANYIAPECNTRELDAAKSLYASILDTIHAHEITFPQFMRGLSLRGEFHSIPINRGMSEKRYQLILDIKKAAMDLPESVRSAAIELVNDIYGPENDQPYAFYETEDFKAYINSPDYQAYRKKYAEEMHPIELMAKQRNYRADLKELYPEMPLEELDKRVQEASERLQYPDYDMERLDYNDYKTDEFYRRLDEIFENYIKR